MNKQCIIVFPVYKPLSSSEISILEQALKMTIGYKQVFVTYKDVSLNISQSILESLDREYFDPKYFESIYGYNKLMLSKEFYERFSEYEYMLIHQTDSYLFKPELEYWCNKGYDYLGAPWLRLDKLSKKNKHKFLRYIPFVYSELRKKKNEVYNAVGNGGLSLRNINAFLTVLRNKKSDKLIDKYERNMILNTYYNEDVFWGTEAPKIYKKFRIPAWQEALGFAFELCPEFAYEYMHNKLPFGCHAFNVHGIDFWKKHILLENIDE